VALREIYTSPATCLREKSVEIKKLLRKHKHLISDMVDTIEHHASIGLAAPQVGENTQIAVIDLRVTNSKDTVSQHEDSNFPGYLVLINPEVIDGMGDITIEEGCLSIPGSTFSKMRAYISVTRYLDTDMRHREITAGGILSIAIQHETDHLNGILVSD
tara:strand:+ start:128 stop:604 length:477 start_codon:yes stop_codon:yes gene_type:complete